MFAIVCLYNYMCNASLSLEIFNIFILCFDFKFFLKPLMQIQCEQSVQTFYNKKVFVNAL